MSCHYEYGALVHGNPDDLVDCLVCGLGGCTDPDCDCGHKPAVIEDGNHLHAGACLAVYRDGEREMAALALAVAS